MGLAGSVLVLSSPLRPGNEGVDVGPGLSLVAAIVGQHDGTVRLTEPQGSGATMTVRSPGIAR